MKHGYIKVSKHTKFKHQLLYGMVPIISLISLVVMIQEYIQYGERYISKSLLIFYMGFIIVFHIVFLLFFSYQQTGNTLNEDYSSLMSQQTFWRTYMTTIDIYQLQLGKFDSNDGTIESSDIVCIYLSKLITAKKIEMNHRNIEFNHNIDVNYLNIAIVDLLIIISNLLDSTMIICQLQEAARIELLVSEYQSDKLRISCICHNIKQVAPISVDFMIISQICKKNNGTLDYHTDENCFMIYLTLDNMNY